MPPAQIRDPFTVSTEHGAWRKVRSATLPSSACTRPVWPRVPRTMRSAPISSARSTMADAAGASLQMGARRHALGGHLLEQRLELGRSPRSARLRGTRQGSRPRTGPSRGSACPRRVSRGAPHGTASPARPPRRPPDRRAPRNRPLRHIFSIAFIRCATSFTPRTEERPLRRAGRPFPQGRTARESSSSADVRNSPARPG